MDGIATLKEEFGLNEYEARIYGALLSRGISSAGELTDAAKVPRSRCYDVLESLERKGFVFPRLGRPIRYIAISPLEVVQTLQKKVRIEQSRKLALIDELEGTEMYDELVQLYAAGSAYIDGTALSAHLSSKASVNARLRSMLKGASTVIIHTDEEGVARKSRILRRAKPKGKPIIHAPSDRYLDVPAEFVKSTRNLRLVQADDQVLFFTDERSDTAFWFKSPSLAAIIGALQ